MMAGCGDEETAGNGCVEFLGWNVSKRGCIRYKTLPSQDARCSISYCNLKVTEGNKFMWDFNVLTMKAVDTNARIRGEEEEEERKNI